MARGSKKTSGNPGDVFGAPPKIESPKEEVLLPQQQITPVTPVEDSVEMIEESSDDIYGALLKKKKKQMKITFELDEDTIKLMNEVANKFPHGFKKKFANNAIRNEAMRIAKTHNIKLKWK